MNTVSSYQPAMSANPSLRTAIADLAAVHGWPAACLLLVLVASLPLAPALLPWAAAAVVIALLARRGHVQAPRMEWRSPLPYAILLYLLHLAGMLWTGNTAFGWFDLQVKASLLLLPLVALMIRPEVRVGRAPLLFVFSLGNATAVIICILAALLRVARGTEFSAAQEVFSSRWSVFLHPSYFAMYLLTAIAAWGILPVARWMRPAASNAVLAILCLGVVLCGSKIGWLLLGALFIALIVLRRRDRSMRNALAGIAGASLIALLALLMLSPYAWDRVREMWRASAAATHDDGSVTSSEVRRLTWRCALELIERDPLAGTGTGDIKDELLRTYHERGYAGAEEHRLNAHNQFLQTAACLGMPALLVLLAMIFVPVRMHWRDPFAVLFLLITAANWLVESMLEVQAGVVFFSFMLMLLSWTGRERSSPTSRPGT